MMLISYNYYILHASIIAKFMVVAYLPISQPKVSSPIETTWHT